jgi:hypothetical protein
MLVRMAADIYHVNHASRQFEVALLSRRASDAKI